MKAKGSMFLGLVLGVLPLAGGCAKASNPPPPVAVAVTPIDPSPAAESEVAPAPVPAAAPDLENAPVAPVSTTPSLPANLHPSGPAAELMRLANSGIDETVMLAYVTNSAGTFNLAADDIIYLKDLGVPGSVIAAAIQRDEALRAAAPSAGAVVPAPVYTTPAPVATAPSPVETVPSAESPVAPSPTAGVPVQPVMASEPVFYDSLAPYGSWVEVDGYGRCWQPTVAVVDSGWQPYFDGGHWVYSDCGWYWYSDYSWGWAPFHYGRWFRHHRLGWCWAPDTVWGPAWVDWRYADDYCGWAPLPPGAGFSIGIGLTFHGRPVHEHEHFGLRAEHYPFVPISHLQDHRLHNYKLPRGQAEHVYARSVSETHLTRSHGSMVNAGIAPERVATATHHPVTRVAIHEANTAFSPGARAEHLDPHSRSLTVYRPPSAAAPKPATTTSTVAGNSRPGVAGTSWHPTANTGSHWSGTRNVTAPEQMPGRTWQPAPAQSAARPTWPTATHPSSPPAANASNYRLAVPSNTARQGQGTQAVPAPTPATRPAATHPYTAPTYQAPSRSSWQEVPRYSSAPAYHQSPAHSYSPPVAAPAPHSSTPESYASRSEFHAAAPAPSAASSHNQSNANPGGRSH